MNDDEPLDSAIPEPSEIYESVSAMWVPPTTEELQQLLPQIKLLELIAYGGMGAVYKARQLTLDRLVAIKILPPEALNNGDINHVERFKNEARLMARLNHPDIVTVYDFGETSDGLLYFIMEFVDGTDVSKMIESQGRLPPQYALAITAHVCDALQYAHTHGVIHHDIKPGNVLINMEGEVKVADFGIASMGVAYLVGLTEINVTLGTPDYIAPEALTIGVDVDRRADLYSVGVMLYHMLTRTLPQGEYQPASQLAGCDVRYDSIIARALQQDRELRYQSALEIRRDLDDIIATPVMQEGDVIGRAAIPKQYVHRRAVNAPVFRRPVASEYNIGHVPRNHADKLWVMVIVVVLAAGVYVWQKQGKFTQSLAGNQKGIIAKSKEVSAPQPHSQASGQGASSIFDATDALKPPPMTQDPAVSNSFGKPDSTPNSSPSPQQSLSALDIASGIWTIVHDSQGGSKQLESNNARFGPECRDGAIRATIFTSANAWPYIYLRCSKDGSRYGFILNPTGKAEIGYWKSGASRGEVVKEVDYDKNIVHWDHTIELRAIGTKLTALVNGVEMLSVEDENVGGGCFGIEAKKLGAYGEIAILKLDHLKSSDDLTDTPGNPSIITDPRLSQIEAQFQQAYDRDIVRAHDASVSDLNAKYVAAIDRAETAAIKAGKSDEVLRLKEEKQRVQNKQPISLTDFLDPVPASLRQLRGTYADALVKINHDSDLKARSYYTELDKQFDSLQEKLIREHRAEDAQLVKDKRDQIADKISRH